MIRPLQCDEKILNFSDLRLAEVIQEVQARGVGIFYDQNLSKSNFIKLMKRIGICEVPNKFMNPADSPEICLVTGKKTKLGEKIGMFGEGELGWHSNGNSRHQIDKILVGLYCVQSDKNAVLSLCQTSEPFYALTKEEQEYWKTIKIRLKFINNTIYHLEEGDPELEFMSQHRGSIRKLVDRHPITGQYYFYFPYHFIVKAWEGSQVIDHQKMIDKLSEIIFQSKYQYHIVLQNNDLLMMDQLTTLHRRSPVTSERLLWRVATDYDVLFQPEQDFRVTPPQESSNENFRC